MKKTLLLYWLPPVLILAALYAAAPWLAPEQAMAYDPFAGRVFTACVIADRHGVGAARLSAWGNKVESLILGKSYSKNARERAVALDVMSTLRTAAVENRLLELVRHADAETRCRAIDALAFYEKDHGDALAPVFANEVDDDAISAFLDYYGSRPRPEIASKVNALTAHPQMGGRARVLLRKLAANNAGAEVAPDSPRLPPPPDHP